MGSTACATGHAATTPVQKPAPAHTPRPETAMALVPSPAPCAAGVTGLYPETDPEPEPAAPPRARSAASRSTKTTSSSANASAAKQRRARLGRAMTNAERGRAFRERRAKYAGELEVDIYRLRAHVAELESVRDLWQSTRIHAARTSDTGSLVRLVQEYLTLFRYGFRTPATKSLPGSSPVPNDRQLAARPSLVSPEIVQAKISYQEHFLRRVMAHDARVGESVGPEASISNWNGYTTAHGNQRIDVHGISAIGSDDHLVTEAHVTFNGKITETTFRVLYPRALHRHDLLAVFLNRNVQFHAVFRHEFTPDGQIQHEGVEIGFVEGLLATGAPLGDVMELLRLSIMSPVSTIAERIEEADPEVIPRQDPKRPETPRSPEVSLGTPLDETSSNASASEDDHIQRDKLRMEYILGA